MTEEENMMFLLDLYFDIKSTALAEQIMINARNKAEHIEEILKAGGIKLKE